MMDEKNIEDVVNTINNLQKKYNTVLGLRKENLGILRRWFWEERLHRIDGPAVEYVNGDSEYYIDGVFYFEGEYNTLLKQIRTLPLELKATDPRKWVRELPINNKEGEENER